MTLDPRTAGSYQSIGNDAEHKAANPTPVAETWSRSKRGVVVGAVVVFGMLLVLGFAVFNTSPSSELLDVSLLEDSSSLSPFVSFRTCPEKAKTVGVEDEAVFTFDFGKGVYKITVLDFPGGPSRRADYISLEHFPSGTPQPISYFAHPVSSSQIRILGDGFHPSIYLLVGDEGDLLRVKTETRPASVEIRLSCDGYRDFRFPPGIIPMHANDPETLRTYPLPDLETVGIVNDVPPRTRVTASLGDSRSDRYVWVGTLLQYSPMMGIGMRDDKNMRDSSGNLLPYEWESNADITVNTYLAEL